MFAQALSRRLDRRGIHYAWLIAALTFMVMLTTSAALGLPGAFLRPLSREMGWNTDQISSILAFRFALFGLMAPFSALLMDRFGVRNVVCAALALIAGGMALATVSTELWQLFVAWGLMLGVGSGLTALVLAAVVANRWFSARRGLVIGILTASAATGQLAFLPVAAWLIEHTGWRVAVLPVLAACAVLALLVFGLMRSRPAEVGLAAFGEVPASTPVPPAPQPAVPFTLSGPFRVLRDAARNQAFWVLAGTFFICGLSTNGLIQTHFIALCGDFGMGPVPAASALAMMGAFDFVGTILSGWLSDRYDSRKLLFWYYALRGLSLFWLPHSTFTLYGLSIFAMFYGLDWIATVPPTVKLAATAFGRERAPMVFGWIFAAHQIGAAVAAFGAGLSRTLLLTYTPALYAAGAACLVAALMALMVSRQRAGVAAEAARA
ncbi:MFS transporter [Cupriavidus taiwanensis]|uniref:Transporter, Major facilitator superfamily MFS_1 n=1 Tax=Cupriavidus taiwanensis TaxID=164546 RepID=A0A7Z7NP50_9BURK|nr:MFS transporter [Cupriavidus taiwanensis]SOZ10321.1 transporter, Major facilitator superfamily MFS_1 [Cupriavidus taiwanensis]SOZ12490.1 transporter, Major facilitator superfamily MFS_1 [Cupriavidus taiwanensis]SOZ43796.1 transporter, Major facilitator superfamily MFS_1 [Cupriavidus taiwanensis]SPC23037.1 transporter, Major facilitator superfamily MFS_1 [Cupriavidus taiwanensis]SPD54546.1 Transporter, Major facilitator superfamily MFS_1 [Cupriavidus taiwanensis]